MNDRELEQMAQDLGQRAAANLNVERTAGQVVARLRAARRAVAWWQRRDVLAAAAAAAVLVGGGLVARRLVFPPGHDLAVPAVSTTLQMLSVGELEEVLDSLVVDAPASELASAGLQDLDDGQLAELLQRLEG